jgi:hypothetical protein
MAKQRQKKLKVSHSPSSTIPASKSRKARSPRRLPYWEDRRRPNTVRKTTMARGRKRNPRILIAVERMLLDAEPPSRIRAEIARRFKVAARTVTGYITECDEARADEERVHAKHRRPRARAVATAALARCLIRAQRLTDEADAKLRKANRYDAEVHKALEDGTIDSLGGGLEDDAGGETKLDLTGAEPVVDEADSPERKRKVKRLRTKSQLAARYHRDAMETLKRAEIAEQRADAWFTQLAKVSGIYEPEVFVLDDKGSFASMTSAQRRTREAAVLTKLKKHLAKLREEAEQKRAAAEGAAEVA